MSSTSLIQFKKAMEAPNADETFGILGALGFGDREISCLINKEICDKQSLIKATEQELIDSGLSAEQAAALKAIFPAAS